MTRGGARAGAGRLQTRFTLDKERAKKIRELAKKQGLSELEALNLLIDKAE